MKSDVKNNLATKLQENIAESKLEPTFENPDLQDDYERNSSFVDQLVAEQVLGTSEQKDTHANSSSDSHPQYFNKPGQPAEAGNLHYLFILILIYLEKKEISFASDLSIMLTRFRVKN